MPTLTERPARPAPGVAFPSVAFRPDSAPRSLDQQFAHARSLSASGRHEEAKLAYFDLLAQAPTHFGALNNLGNLLHQTKRLAAARTALLEAVRCHPQNPLGHLNLAHVLQDEGELPLARRHYETALHLAPDNSKAHHGLALVLTKLGDHEAARTHREKSDHHRTVRVIPHLGNHDPIRLLLLLSAADGNVPLGKFLDQRIFSRTEIVTDYFPPDQPLPPHDLVLNAIGDAELCRPALTAAESLLTRTTAPIINHPYAVLATSRAHNAARLAAISGVVTPKIMTFPRAFLASPDAASLLSAHGFTFPLLLRTPGFHTGHHFIKIESAPQLAPALANLPGDHLTVIQYLNARSADGKTRKYRVMMIDGKLHPLHAAISSDWKIHYFTAEMATNAGHRAEDAAFLQDMPRVLGPRAIAALHKICATLALDYAGIDFSLGPDGEILFFEANAAMNVVPPNCGENWNYRRAPVRAISNAVLQMLLKRAPLKFVAF